MAILPTIIEMAVRCEYATINRRTLKGEWDMIQVKFVDSGNPMKFDVRIQEGHSESQHHVTLQLSTYTKLIGDHAINPENLVNAAFQFLLEREPKEAILSEFDINVIATYFPDFKERITAYF